MSQGKGKLLVAGALLLLVSPVWSFKKPAGVPELQRKWTREMKYVLGSAGDSFFKAMQFNNIKDAEKRLFLLDPATGNVLKQAVVRQPEGRLRSIKFDDVNKIKVMAYKKEIIAHDYESKLLYTIGLLEGKDFTDIVLLKSLSMFIVEYEELIMAYDLKTGTKKWELNKTWSESRMIRGIEVESETLHIVWAHIMRGSETVYTRINARTGEVILKKVFDFNIDITGDKVKENGVGVRSVSRDCLYIWSAGIVCLNYSDGNVLWQKKIDSYSGFIWKKRLFFEPLFVENDSRVIVYDNDGKVTCLNAKTGMPVWEKIVSDSLKYCSLSEDKKSVICTLGKMKFKLGNNGRVVSKFVDVHGQIRLNAADGNQQMSFVSAEPVLGSVMMGQEQLFFQEEKIVFYDMATFSKKGTIFFGKQFDTAISGIFPIEGSDTVFLCSNKGETFFLNVKSKKIFRGASLGRNANRFLVRLAVDKEHLILQTMIMKLGSTALLYKIHIASGKIVAFAEIGEYFSNDGFAYYPELSLIVLTEDNKGRSTGRKATRVSAYAF